MFRIARLLTVEVSGDDDNVEESSPAISNYVSPNERFQFGEGHHQCQLVRNSMRLLCTVPTRRAREMQVAG